MSEKTFTKEIHVEVTKSSDPNFDARFVMSAASPDRVNDTIAKDAYSANVGKRIIALWQHDPDKPMGFWENVKMEGDRLVGDLKVASTNLGLMIKQLLADNVPLGASIGFRGTGSPNQKGGIHFKTLDIFECSVVSIPAHPRAMRLAKSLGLEEFIEDQSSIDDDMAASGPTADEVISKAKAATLSAMKTLHKGKSQ